MGFAAGVAKIRSQAQGIEPYPGHRYSGIAILHDDFELMLLPIPAVAQGLMGTSSNPERFQRQYDYGMAGLNYCLVVLSRIWYFKHRSVHFQWIPGLHSRNAGSQSSNHQSFEPSEQAKARPCSFYQSDGRFARTA